MQETIWLLTKNAHILQHGLESAYSFIVEITLDIIVIFLKRHICLTLSYQVGLKINIPPIDNSTPSLGDNMLSSFPATYMSKKGLFRSYYMRKLFKKFTLLLSKFFNIHIYLNHLKLNIKLCSHWIFTPYICLNFNFSWRCSEDKGRKATLDHQ